MNKFKIKEYKLGDTIAAIATFPSKSALGVIKISGKKALSIIEKMFKPAKKKNIKKVKTHTLHYGWIIDKNKKKKHKPQSLVDEVLVSVMKGPNSYTREDVVEISCHGGGIVLNRILELILACGGRLALPGEFTYRALARGRIDLFQAQGIMAIVEAKSLDSLELATSQLKGFHSERIKKLKAQVKDIFIYTESIINFPEEEIGDFSSKLKKEIGQIKEEIKQICEAGNCAKVIFEGLRCVICGKTNVGKSTLFNHILQEERVIVSKIKGTTRDVVEETINIKGVSLKIYDTAGILEPKDIVTKKAIEKTSQAFDEADLVILVLDSSRKLDKDDFFLLEKAKTKNTIVVMNKTDLKKRLDSKKIPSIFKTKVEMSALRDCGLKLLEKAIHRQVYKQGIGRENVIFLNRYQHEILRKIGKEVSKAEVFLKEGYTIDFINLSLKEILNDLGKLSGEVFSQDILNSIFNEFCIGK